MSEIGDKEPRKAHEQDEFGAERGNVEEHPRKEARAEAVDAAGADSATAHVAQAAADGDETDAEQGAGDAASTARDAVSTAGEAGSTRNGAESELEILRSELGRLREELNDAKARADEMQDRYLRARADLENFRRRAANDADRAREAGLDSAVLPVLTVFDDLRRALGAADEGDPGKIVPGVRSVLGTLERNLESLGISPLGNVGEPFDPGVHEALTSVPAEDADKADTIAQVFEVGFQRGDRLIRPARVVVYQG